MTAERYSCMEEEVLKVALAKDMGADIASWSEFFSIMGHSLEESPDGFAGNFLSKIPGLSNFAKGTYSIVWRQGKAFYDRIAKSLMENGISELTAKVAAGSLTGKIYPLLDQAPWLACLVLDRRLTWEQSFRVTGLFIRDECLYRVCNKLKDGKGLYEVLKTDYLAKFTHLNQKQQDNLVSAVLTDADQVLYGSTLHSKRCFYIN